MPSVQYILLHKSSDTLHVCSDMQKDSPRHKPFVPLNPEAVEAARGALPSDELLTLVVEAFEALGDSTRARIVYALGTGPLCVRDLAILVGVSESGVSRQLRLLKDRRVVKLRRAGNGIYYAVDDQHVAALIHEAEYHADVAGRRRVVDRVGAGRTLDVGVNDVGNPFDSAGVRYQLGSPGL